MASRGRRQDHYEVLGVDPDAPDEVIRAAYRALANKYHPDRNGGDPNAELRLKRLNAAFQVLGDPAKRKQYDELTQSPQGSDDGPPEPTKEPPRWKVPEERASREPPHEPARVSSGDKPRSILRTILRVVGIIVGLCALGLGGVIWYVTDQDAMYKADQASVTITATYDPADCRKPKYPIQITIVNSSSTRTVKTVTFDLEAYEEGRSDNLVSYSDGRFKESTKVVRPGVTKTTCWIFPTLIRAVSNGVSFRANKDHVDFYGENEPIPPEPATTASVAPAVPVPNVPPLLANETPPSDGPNYIEPRELSSGGIVAGFDSCESSARKSDPSLSADVLSSYCTCFVDTYSHNFSASRDLTKALPTVDQLKKCATVARSGGPSPFGSALPRGTADILKAWTGCINNNGDKDHGVYCDCLVDLDTAAQAHAHIWQDVPGKQTSDQFVAGCQVADQYWAATKIHLTVRQFKTMVVAAAQ